MRDRVREQKIVWGKDRVADERAVLAKISELPEPDRSMGLRLHSMVTAAAPALSPRLWYGMPAYTKDGDDLCFFQPACRFGARYGTFGFNDGARLDDGEIWATSFALHGLSPEGEERIAALVRKAVR